MAFIRSVTGSTRQVILNGWEVTTTPPLDDGPNVLDQLASFAPTWLAVQTQLPHLNPFNEQHSDTHHGQNLGDGDGEHWFRCQIQLPTAPHVELVFNGLATIVEVFWNRQSVLKSTSAFITHRLVWGDRPTQGELLIRCKSLKTALKQKRPRPRWRAPLIPQKDLRWFRTPLLGHISGWNPPSPPIGPYRPVEVVAAERLRVLTCDVQTSVEDEQISELCRGRISVRLHAEILDNSAIQGAMIKLGDETPHLCQVEVRDNQLHLTADAVFERVRPWWPHTHGTPQLYPLAVELLDLNKKQINIQLADVGFRHLKFRNEANMVGLAVNKTAIFCRGACWTPFKTSYFVTPLATESEIRPLLEMVKNAGLNMLRIGGTMDYETQVFYDLCDQLGIMVWQDFMFANMDYPFENPDFLKLVEQEVEQFLDRTQLCASLVTLCGGSETEQQPAMIGVDRTHWQQPFFKEDLRLRCQKKRGDVPYWSSSPTGGDLPFQVDQGISHYYGVGAYLRPLHDAHTAGVKFATECLGFAQVPSERTIEHFLEAGQAPFHHPKWKERVPRDSGASLDFEDIREFYTEALFGVSPAVVRRSDPERLLSMARITTGEVIGRTMAQWRRPQSLCQGALIWFLKDLVPGTGWGLFDSFLEPKSAYFYLKRVLAPVSLVFYDGGLNGLDLVVFNDSPQSFTGQLGFSIYKDLSTQVCSVTKSLELPPRSTTTIRASSFLEGFFDTTYAYRFGPLSHELVYASLTTQNGLVAEDYYFPKGFLRSDGEPVGLKAEALREGNQTYLLRIHSKTVVQSVALDTPGYQPSDNYFHLAPEQTKEILLKPIVGRSGLPQTGELSGRLKGVHHSYPTKITVRGV